MNMKKLMWVCLFTAALTACSVPPQQQAAPKSYVDPGHTEIRAGIPDVYVYKFVDKEDNVLCYVMDGHNSGGIHCLPYNDEGTHLDVVEEVPERQYGD